MRWGELTSGKREAPAPLEGNIRATVIGITAVWAVAFLVQLPFYGRYADDGRTEWIWTCLAGVGLGFLGLWYVARRDAALRRAQSPAETGTEEHGERREGSGSDGTGDDDAGRG
jgi:hypothetical protein